MRGIRFSISDGIILLGIELTACFNGDIRVALRIMGSMAKASGELLFRAPKFFLGGVRLAVMGSFLETLHIGVGQNLREGLKTVKVQLRIVWLHRC